jgi:hypothetical protein
MTQSHVSNIAMRVAACGKNNNNEGMRIILSKQKVVVCKDEKKFAVI